MDKPVDYGIDFKIDIVKNRQVIGQNFSVQLKAHEQLGRGKLITASLDRSTINLYLARLEPILIICYITEQNEAYYTWFTENSVDLTKNQQSHSLRFNPDNKISVLNWDIIANRVDEIFSRRFLLHSFPEFDFSNMGAEEKDAAAHYLKQDYETAGYLFKQLQKRNPSGCWLNSIAMCHYALYQYKDALVNINKALSMADLTEIRLNKAAILAEYGIESGNRAMVLEAKQIFRSAVDIDGNTGQHFNYANTLGWLGENEEAKKQYEKVLKMNPNHAEAWKNLGEIYSRTKKTTKEFQCYDNALAIKPKLPQALMCKGIALIREHQNYEDGIIYLNQTIEVEPDLFSKYSSGYFWFAYANFKTENKHRGLDFLSQGLNHYPGDPYLLNLKRDYFKENWQSSEEIKSEAIEFMLYRLELEPNDAIALECLIRIYLSEENKIEAINSLRKHTVLFRRSVMSEIINEYFNIEPFLDALYNYQHYCNFRHEHPMEKDLNPKLSPTFYFEFTELVGLKMFHDCLEYIKNNKENKNFEKNIFTYQFEQALKYYPFTAPFMMTESVEQKKIFGEQMCNAMVHIPILAIREIARINGYFTVKYNLNKHKMNLAVKGSKEKEYNQKILLACLTEIQQRYHFFPDE